MLSVKSDIRVVANAKELSLKAAEEFVHRAEEAVQARGIFTIRVTLTAPMLNNALCTIFLVSGSEKTETLRAVLEGNPEPERFPAQIICPKQGTVLWLVDQAAARLLRLKQEENHG